MRLGARFLLMASCLVAVTKTTVAVIKPSARMDVAFDFDRIPRGGGGGGPPGLLGQLGGGRFVPSFLKQRRTADQAYQLSLEEQVLLLDRQLRQAREEITELRTKRKGTIREQLVQKAKLVNSNQDQKESFKEEQKLLQQRIDALQRQLEQLEQLKSELEELLQVSQARIEELQSKLASQQGLTTELERNYQEQIATLRQSLQDLATQQQMQMESYLEERIRQAVELARREAQNEVDDQIRQVRMAMERDHAKALQVERDRSIRAVEVEKKKMRTLVKALAIREKKLLAAQASATRRDQQQGNADTKTTMKSKRRMNSTGDNDDDDDTESSSTTTTSRVDVPLSSSIRNRNPQLQSASTTRKL